MSFNNTNNSNTQNSPKKGRVILNKGKRSPGNHHFEIFIINAVFYATIIHADHPEVRETFQINSKIYPNLENAVDSRIRQLMW